MPTYTVKIGPYIVEVDPETGHHEVIHKEAKKEQAIYQDSEGWKITDPLEYAIRQLEDK